MKICIVISTGGSVVNKVLGCDYFRNSIHSIVVDRPNGGAAIEARFNIPIYLIDTAKKEQFSEELLFYLKRNKIDLVVSFYLKLFVGDILREYKFRMINLHLSLLPAFPGFNSFEQAICYGVKFLGTTIHFIDDTVDNGIPIIQSIVVNDLTVSQDILRHKLFIQQCKMLLQVIKWFDEGRIVVKNNLCVVKNTKFDSVLFSPELDFKDAINLK